VSTRVSGPCRRPGAVSTHRGSTHEWFADADAIRPEHIAEFYELLGGGRGDAGLDGSLRAASRWAIVPNTTHYDILGSPNVTLFATEFLR
jgi:hypothetical protein